MGAGLNVLLSSSVASTLILSCRGRLRQCGHADDDGHPEKPAKAHSGSRARRGCCRRQSRRGFDDLDIYEPLRSSEPESKAPEALAAYDPERPVQECLLDGLPPLPVLQAYAGELGWASGPHETCNYVLPGRLLAGSYPGDREEPGHSLKIRALLEAGVDTFICLQERSELEGFNPYASRAKELWASSATVHEVEPEVLSCEIPDGGVTTRHRLAVAIATLVRRLREGRTVYVHCWGGHGRTGTLICAFLVKVYGLTVDEAKDYFMALHSQRRVRNSGGQPYWPHSSEQYEQARSFEGDGLALEEESLALLEAK